MHESSYRTMARAVGTHLAGLTSLKILDVGSMDINGTYKDLFKVRGWLYQGLDIEKGPNVDIVVGADYQWKSIPDGEYDVVICGQVMEHVTEPWSLAREIGRVCKRGGFGFVIAPNWPMLHRCPLDCWRVYPDGMEHVMTKYGGFSKLECALTNVDTWFFGKKL